MAYPVPTRAPNRAGRSDVFGMMPLLALPVLVYNGVALFWLGGFGSSGGETRLDATLFSMTMTSGGIWAVSLSDLLLAVSLVILFIELLKSTTSRRVAIINHALSMGLFIACLVELLLLSAFATSTYFLITLMVLLDVLAGFIVTIVSARRDFGIAEDS